MAILKYFLCLFALLLLAGCFVGEVERGSTLTGERTWVMGHGGSGFATIDNHWPNNSELSILQAVDVLGADGVEIDIQLTADSVLVLYHDNRLESETDCRACLYEQRWEELEDCRYRGNFAVNIGQNEGLWRFEELVANFADRPVPPRIFIDLATPADCGDGLDMGDYFRTFARQLVKMIRLYEAEKWIWIELTPLAELEYLQSIAPDLQLAWLGPLTAERLEIAEDRGFWGVAEANDRVEKNEVEEAHRLGLGVIVYEVKIREGMLRAVAKGVDAIETENIPLLHSVLE